MLQLKSLTQAGIERALERAEFFRLLNEPSQSESVCLDILSTDPHNQRALVTLVLALTDQFSRSVQISDTRLTELIQKVRDEYQRTFLTAVVFERRARAVLEQHLPQSTFIAYELCRQAMTLYEAAEGLRPAGNDDSILRWNACVRMIQQHRLEPQSIEHSDDPLE